ncbi:hypothetical protein BKA70DRAFT_1440850 [Coprinopsis sp. MPI-PUGE-AT-0042]|nr:hypothetical protein BKA70DRAFT_1440850 [Coprinopsis sp. MPI-PUGE-AT-0042]
MKRQRSASPSDPSLVELDDDEYEDVVSNPPTPPRQPKRRKAALNPPPFQESFKAAQAKASASKPTGGDKTTREMLARLTAQVNQHCVSSASQETNKGLRKPSTRVASSSKSNKSSRSSKSSSSSSSRRTSQPSQPRGQHKAATEDNKETIFVRSLALLPLGVISREYLERDDIMSGEEDGGISELVSCPDYEFQSEPPKTLDSNYLATLESCGLYFRAADPKALIPIPAKADHRQLAHILAKFLPVPFKHINAQIRLSHHEFPSPFMLVHKNRYSYSIVGGSCPDASDIDKCFNPDGRVGAAKKMLILVTVDKILTRELLKWKKEHSSSQVSSSSLRLSLPSSSSASYEESRNASIEDALRSDNEDDEVVFLPRPPPPPSSSIPPPPPRATRVAKITANAALQQLMADEEGGDGGELADAGSSSDHAPAMDTVALPPAPELTGQEDGVQESLTRPNSPIQDEVSNLSTTLHSHLSFSAFTDPWGTQRELDFDF